MLLSRRTISSKQVLSVDFRTPSVLFLATCVFLFNWCSCPCPLPIHLHQKLHVIYIQILYDAFLECVIFLLLSCPCFFLTASLLSFRLKKQIRLLSLIHTSINNIIREWIMPLIYSVNLRIQSECGKIWTRKTPNTDTFYAVAGSCKINT